MKQELSIRPSKTGVVFGAHSRMPFAAATLRHIALANITFVMCACAAARQPFTPPIATDRPDFTEGTTTVATGHVQAEGGYTYTRSGLDREQSLGELLLRIGTSSWSEFRLGVNSYDVNGPSGNRQTGFEDATLGAKFRLYNGTDAPSLKPALSLLVGSTVPTGARALNDRTMRPEAKLAAGWQLSERVGLSSNANYSYESESGERFSQWAGTLSLDTELSPTLGGYVEYYGFYGPAFTPQHYVNAGVTRPFGNDTQLDLRAGLRLNAPYPGYFFGVGFARRW